MTSNVGTEYINLKQAKYNRTMSQRRDTAASPSLRPQSSAARVQRSTSSVRERTSFASPALRAAAHSASAGYARTARSTALPKTGEGRYDDGLLSDIADAVGKAIAAKAPITCREMTVPEARAEGAIGLFASKYGELVKVYTMGSFSKEICGGPHATNTGDLKSFKIQKEESSSAGVRRIKAVIGTTPDEKTPTL